MPNYNKLKINWLQSIVLLTGLSAYLLIKSGYLETTAQTENSLIEELFNIKAQGKDVLLSGQVYKLLSDDNKGVRHQRFLMKVGTYSLLVAHNIDIAPPVPLETGDVVYIKGKYEWNEQGGMVHWTHHDPQQRQDGGWIEHQGKKFK